MPRVRSGCTTHDRAARRNPRQPAPATGTAGRGVGAATRAVRAGAEADRTRRAAAGARRSVAGEKRPTGGGRAQGARRGIADHRAVDRLPDLAAVPPALRLTRTDGRNMDDTETLRRILRESRTIAVVGLSAHAYRPSHSVAKYMLE